MSAAQAKNIRFEFHGDDKRIKRIALGVAVLLHVSILFIPFPEVAQIVPEKPKGIFVVRQLPLPPPKVELREIPQVHLQRLVFVPDTTLDDPEPIREPAPEIAREPFQSNVPFMIGSPPTPPRSGPRFVDGHHVTSPERIEESAVKPVYPEIARRVRAGGRVIIQAVILRDGTVTDIEVLSCTNPGMQFEEAAIEAVKQWRYTPAMQGGRPVDVFFTVVVEFDLS